MGTSMITHYYSYKKARDNLMDKKKFKKYSKCWATINFVTSGVSIAVAVVASSIRYSPNGQYCSGAMHYMDYNGPDIMRSSANLINFWIIYLFITSGFGLCFGALGCCNYK